MAFEENGYNRLCTCKLKFTREHVQIRHRALGCAIVAQLHTKIHPPPVVPLARPILPFYSRTITAITAVGVAVAAWALLSYAHSDIQVLFTVSPICPQFVFAEQWIG